MLTHRIRRLRSPPRARRRDLPARVLRRAARQIDAGRQSRRQQIVRAGNTRTDSAHNRYNIAPEELIKIQRQARTLGLDIVGFYHSHPDHPAQWSKTDFDEAHWLGCSYIITSVEKGKAVMTNSFLLTGTERTARNSKTKPSRS